ncbi:MAG: glycosyl transferase, group 1, partial [Bryobacterales bacterium]|nr:glycosyl transferase, group 1 [Bryobacterales bacterium]
ERYGAEEKRMFPFPYEPDYSIFESVPEARLDAVRGQYGLLPGRRYLIFSGRFVPVKRVDLLLKAFAEVAEQRPGWDLILIGDGPLRGPLLDTLPPHVRARIVWTGFIADATNVAAIYRFGDVLILPSDVEPWGVVVTEAAMSSLALICSSVTGAGVELIRDGLNGRLFAAGDPIALRDAILDVTKDENTNRMKAASRRILDDWRHSSDPVEGLRASLRFSGIIQ